MREGVNKYKMLFVITLLIALVLILVLVYMLAIKPAINGYAVKKQNEGVNFVVVDIIKQIQRNNYAVIPLGNNQSLYLAPFDPNQQASTGQQLGQ